MVSLGHFLSSEDSYVHIKMLSKICMLSSGSVAGPKN